MTTALLNVPFGTGGQASLELLADSSAILVVLAAAFLVFRTFRELYLLTWILGWACYLLYRVTSAAAGSASPEWPRALAHLAFVAAVALFVSSGRTRARESVIAAGLVVWLLVAFWAPLMASGWPPAGYGELSAKTVRAVPQPGIYLNDDEIYRRVYFLLHRGESYYTAYLDAWAGLRHHPEPPGSPVSVRLPTLYWLWSALPPDPFSIVYAFLALFPLLGVPMAIKTGGELVAHSHRRRVCA